jgi:hypothetical protein
VIGGHCVVAVFEMPLVLGAHAMALGPISVIFRHPVSGFQGWNFAVHVGNYTQRQIFGQPY